MKTLIKITIVAFLLLTLNTVTFAQEQQAQKLLDDSVQREKVFNAIQSNPELMKLFMTDMKKNRQDITMMKSHSMAGMTEDKQEMMEKMMKMTENDTTACKTMMKTMMGRMMKHAQSDTTVRNNMMKMMMGNMMKMTEDDPAARQDMIKMMMANMHKMMEKNPAMQKEMMNKMMGKMMSKAEKDPDMGRKMIGMMMDKPDMMKAMMQMMNEKGIMDEKTMNKTIKKMDKMNTGKNLQSGDHQH